jgi:hypothetical protein
MQESAVLNVFSDHTFALRFSGPPPPSEAVTLQCSVGGSLTTPIGVWLSSNALRAGDLLPAGLPMAEA